MKKLLLLGLMIMTLCCFSAGSVLAQAPIVGKWKTIDDETNEPKSIVQIYEKDGQYYGKIIELFLKPDADQNPTCDKCPDDDPRKNQPTLGMEIIQDLKPDGDVYSGGTILDPKKGKVYKCKIWAEGDELKVQGSFLFISRTQTWHRME
jgi:uncharacterized protein (DUF2147 family)